MTPLFVPSELENVLIDMKRSIEARLYYPALLVALTIPEICAALSLDRSLFVKQKHYVEFVDKYTTPPELGLSGLDCYRLRGGVVHRASFAGHPYFGATHVVFTVPESGARLHAFSMVSGRKTAAMFDVVLFCRAMDAAARRWYQDHEKDPNVQRNLKNLIRYCPNGLSPFVVGAPVVASGI